MANRPWLEQVQKRLGEADLPPAYVRRFMEELADHLEDITEDTMSKEANVSSRLGEPTELADAAVIAYRQGTFFGRHPSARFWVFGVSPILALSLVFVLACVGVAAFGNVCQKCGVCLADHDHLGRLAPGVLRGGLSLVTMVLPAAALTFVYCALARRFRVGNRWMLASCGVLAVIAMLPSQAVMLSDAPGQSLWSIGLSVPPTALQCIQLFVPLAVGCWAARRSKDASSREARLGMAA